MRSIAVTRPAAALVIASIAFAGAASSAQAAAPFSGSVVKKSSLPGNRVKANSLTGVQINESRLGVVPAAKLANFSEFAKSADSAKVADYAKTAGAAETARTAEAARTAETARSADTARTADLAKDSQKLNGRDHTAFMANTVRTVFVASGQISGADGSTTITASCNPDESAIGGGGGWFQTATTATTELDAKVTASVPSPLNPAANGMTGWSVSGRNSSGTLRILRAYAICVPKVAQP